jgi:hypothetical protein
MDQLQGVGRFPVELRRAADRPPGLEAAPRLFGDSFVEHYVVGRMAAAGRAGVTPNFVDYWIEHADRNSEDGLGARGVPKRIR